MIYAACLISSNHSFLFPYNMDVINKELLIHKRVLHHLNLNFISGKRLLSREALTILYN